MSNTTFDSLTHKMERTAAGKLIDVALSHVHKDRQKAMVQMVDFAKQFYGDSFSEETYDHARLVLGNPDSKWSKLINSVLDQTDPHVARTTALNLGYEAFFRGTKMIRENRVKYQCNIPWLILFDPTSACNMHCVGCWAGEYGHKNNLSFEDMDKIVTQGKELGVYLYMLTGGEPLVRKNVAQLVAGLKATPGIRRVTLTTNAVLLAEQLPALLDAGLDSVNISLDTLRTERFREITRRGDLEDAFAGIRAAEDAGFQNLKLDTVLMGGLNDDEIEDFLSLTKEHPWEVRFIELMPMGPCAAWPKERFLPVTEILNRFPALEEIEPNGVARRYRLMGAMGTVGLITPMSHEFCGACRRIRVTADGKLKGCLHSREEISLRGLHGRELEDAILRGILQKPKGHHLTEHASDTPRTMNEIGG